MNDTHEPYDELFQQHYRKAFSFAYRLAGNREDAEDMTQEAFYRAYRSRERFDPERPFLRWLLRIIANLAVDRFRARGRHATLSLDIPLEGYDGDKLLSEIPDEEADPVRHVLRGVMDEELEAALADLPAVFRETVLLCDVEGLSYDEIAAQLGCAVGTVRSRLHRARLLMRRRLARPFASSGYCPAPAVAS